LIKVNFFSSIRIVRIALALTVALWMAGAGCLLGCENMVSAAGSNNGAAAPSSLTIVAAGDVCSSAHAKDCCAKHGSKVGARPAAKSTTSALAGALLPEVGAVPSSIMDNCPLAVNASAALSKAKQDQPSSVLTASPAGAFLSNTPDQTIAFSTRPQLANRGPTYLRCCVFLI
jgi:hypothetical protein